MSLDELYETALQNPKSAYISLLNYQIAYSHLYGKQVDETKGIAALQAVFNDAELPLALAHRCRNILINLATNNRKEFVRYSANVALAQLYLKDAKAEPIKFCKLALLRKALQCLEAATNVDYSAGHINELKASIYRALADLYKSFGITYKQEVARYYQRASDAGDKKRSPI
ncbi:MAG: hypothetical protein HWD59_03705 [Coxiellaceae bacterium]|nr:MAG: hypothetical protein HWD59_03705 [Coxiellaceae bacterium]